MLAYFDRETIKREVGKLKRHSSHAIRDAIPGTVWEADCYPRWIRNHEHLCEVYRYILDHESSGAVVYRFRTPAR